MAIKQAYAVKTRIGAGDLELRADPGESFLIKDIKIFNPAINYATLRVEKATVGFFRIGGPLGSHLPFIQGRSLPDISAHAGSAVAVAAHAALATHKHKAFTHKGSAAGADQLLFVEMLDGEAVSIGANVLAKSGRTTDIDGNTNLISGGTPDPHVIAVAQPDAHKKVTRSMLEMKSLLAWMVAKGLMTGYPVAEGETFRISGVGQAGAIQHVEYEIHEGEDQKPELPNGSRAKEYVFINYGNTGAPINKTGDSVYNISASPAEFPDFPFGKVVPAKTNIALLGILASDFAPWENDATNWIQTMYAKMVKEREILFDEDRNGLLMMSQPGINAEGRDLVAEGWNLLGNYSNIDMRLPFVPAGELLFVSGDEVLLYLTTNRGGTGQSIDIYEQEIGLIQKITRVE